MNRIIAMADDLSGAAETAAAFLGTLASTPGEDAQSAHTVPGATRSHDGAPQVCMLPHPPGELATALRDILQDASLGNTALVVLDTDNRKLPADAAARLRQVLDSIPAVDSSPMVFLKIDSLLRGPVASQLDVLAAEGPVIMAPALPPLGRSTVNGTVHHQGVPLHETTLWHAEPSAPPVTIAAALHPLSTSSVGLTTVRSGGETLAAALKDAALKDAGAERPFPLVVCDAETQADLEAIVSAALSIPGVRFAGASALGSALGTALGTALGAAVARAAGKAPNGSADVVHSSLGQRTTGGFPLLVVGSASGPAREQLQALAADGVPVITLSPADLLAGTADMAALQQALSAGPAAVTVDASTVDPAASSDIAAALARTVAPLARDRPLMLTGGETARSVLDAVGVQRLGIQGEIEHGAVLSLAPDGNPVVTRPGSFGETNSLRTILAVLAGYSTSSPSRTANPPQRAPLCRRRPSRPCPEKDPP